MHKGNFLLKNIFEDNILIFFFENELLFYLYFFIIRVICIILGSITYFSCSIGFNRNNKRRNWCLDEGPGYLIIAELEIICYFL